MTVGVIGEALVDVVTDARGNVVERPGGSPFNVAVALVRLEISAHLFTAIGEDPHGDLLLSHLWAEDVVVTRGRSKARTAVATASLDEAGRATYSFDMEWDPSFADFWPELDALHFGSLGAVITPGAAEVAAVVDRYAGHALISYDPNWRPGVIDAEPRAVVEANAARADVVKLSDDDAAAIYPGVELEDVAHRLLDVGPALVVITRGASGAAAWTAKAHKEVGGAPADVVDTVGAGDAFMAATLAQLHDLDAFTRPGPGLPDDEEGLGRLLRGAMEVSAITCERRGATPPRRQELPPGWPA